MPEIIYDKEDGLVTISEAGRLRKRTLSDEDVVVSLPPGSSAFKKVTNIYVEPETGQLVVIHEE